MMTTNSMPMATTMVGMAKKGVKHMAKKFDNASTGPKISKASESGSKGMPKKAVTKPGGKPTRCMY